MIGTSHKIKNRETPNDKFYTPISLVKIHLELVKPLIGDGVILEAFMGSGNYYNEMKKTFTNDIDFTEIDIGLDFFEYNRKCDYIISNPPYSCIDKVLEKSVELNPKVISYLIGFHNITAKRLEFMKLKGYGVRQFHLTKVSKWFGMSLIITFVKDFDSIISFDRIIHK